MRALLAERIATVSGFLKTLTTVIEFGANAEAQRLPAAMKTLPRLLDGRKKVTEADIDVTLVSGSWKRLVLRAGSHGSTVDENACTMCVLTQFHRHLKRCLCRGLGALPDLGPGGVRELRNPDEPEWDD
ncbi:hypothetical protein ACFPOI_60050 [Nonomuraea angiospora]|uniref:Transposase n=1 Tax=Nonomuraea angiospora TaxID=46172 RepID=A0ABR9LQ10_9ACTN|nr:hypothetical protein [Nonomuraea angiospora]MBE1582744.1 hypothetical protein [Nonomuraea angiospora]